MVWAERPPERTRCWPASYPGSSSEDLVLSPEKEATSWFIKTKALDQRVSCLNGAFDIRMCHLTSKIFF